MTGIYWVIIIFVLQAVIAALAKRAQKNAESQAPKAGSSARPSTAQPFQRANPANATNPTTSAVLPPRPTVVDRASGAASATVGKPSPFQPASSKPTAAKPTPLKVVRPTVVATDGGLRGGAKPVAPRVPAQSSKRTPATVAKSQVSASSRGSSQAPPKSVARPIAIPPEREEADAMASRAKVAQSVAKIRAIESSVSGQHVAGLSQAAKPKSSGARTPATGTYGTGAAALGSLPAFSAARIAEAFRNPHRIREAIILSEVIGPPRGMR